MFGGPERNPDWSVGRSLLYFRSYAMRLILAAIPFIALIGLVHTAQAQSLSAPVAAATQSAPKVGNWVRPLSGGQAMQIETLKGDEAILAWNDGKGAQHHAQFPLADLSVVDGPSADLPSLAEPQPYRPCPANVITQQGQHECLD